MKKQLLFPALLAGLCLLLAVCSAGSRGQIPPPAADAPLSLAEDETPSYLSCRIVDGAEDGILLLAELDTKKGIGLIERIKQGQGKPTKIYVKRFTTQTVPPKPAPSPPEPFAPISEVDFPDLQKSEIPTSRGRKNRLPEVEKTDPNYTKRIQTELIHPGRGPSAEVFSRCVHDAPGDRGKRL